jgi:hypothetical protein
VTLTRVHAELRQARGPGDSHLCIRNVDLSSGSARFVTDPNRTVDCLRQGEWKAVYGDSDGNAWLSSEAGMQSREKQKGRHHPKLYG